MTTTRSLASGITSRWKAVALGCLLGSVVGGAQVAAQQLRACAIPPTGTLYMVGLPGLPQACRSPHHIPVQWNVAGPQGPPGPAFSLVGSGALGEFEVVFTGVVDVPVGVGQGGTVDFYNLQCPSGKKAIVGGLYDYPAMESRPGVAQDQWQVTALSTSGASSVGAVAWVVCAREF